MERQEIDVDVTRNRTMVSPSSPATAKVAMRAVLSPGNLVQQVLGDGAYIDASCGKGKAGHERSNDLTIGRTFVSIVGAFT